MGTLGSAFLILAGYTHRLGEDEYDWAFVQIVHFPGHLRIKALLLHLANRGLSLVLGDGQCQWKMRRWSPILFVRITDHQLYLHVLL